jgi:MoaA/NifB/PqqE/SkfB family radical SAM enzyme
MDTKEANRNNCIEKSQFNLDRLTLGKIAPLESPIVIYIEPAGSCNLRCKFCFHREKQGVKNGIMKFDLAKKMIDDISSLPNKPKLVRISGGGEPLVNPQLTNILEYMAQKNVAEKITLITNGVLLSHTISESIVKFVDHIIISVEGISDSQYMEFTDTKVDFKKFYNEVIYLYECSKNNNCTIAIKIHGDAVKASENKDKFYKLFKDHCDEITIENLVDLYPDVKLDKQSTGDSARFSNIEVKKKKVCPQIFKSLQICSNGVVIPCCADWKQFLNCGNVANENLLNIWKGTKLKKIQMLHLNFMKDNIEICKNCTMNDVSEIDFIDDDVNEIKLRMNL